jgi:hypothetical protein
MSDVNEDEAVDQALAWAEENLETDSLNSSNNDLRASTKTPEISSFLN